MGRRGEVALRLAASCTAIVLLVSACGDGSAGGTSVGGRTPAPQAPGFRGGVAVAYSPSKPGYVSFVVALIRTDQRLPHDDVPMRVKFGLNGVTSSDYAPHHLKEGGYCYEVLWWSDDLGSAAERLFAAVRTHAGVVTYTSDRVLRHRQLVRATALPGGSAEQSAERSFYRKRGCPHA